MVIIFCGPLNGGMERNIYNNYVLNRRGKKWIETKFLLFNGIEQDEQRDQCGFCSSNHLWGKSQNAIRNTFKSDT